MPKVPILGEPQKGDTMTTPIPRAPVVVSAQLMERTHGKGFDPTRIDTEDDGSLGGLSNIMDSPQYGTTQTVDLDSLILFAQEPEQAFTPLLVGHEMLRALSVDQIMVDVADNIRDIVKGDDDGYDGSSGRGTGTDIDNRFEDDPTAAFLNLSQMPWHKPSPINGPRDLQDKFNESYPNDARSGVLSAFNCLLNLTGIGIIRSVCKYMASRTDDGNFSIAKDGGGWKVYTTGRHWLRGIDNYWVTRNVPYDKESADGERSSAECKRELTEKHNMLIVPSSYVGVGRIVTEVDPNDTDLRKQFPGAKNDMVLFPQGTYLVDEQKYTNVAVVKYDADKWLTKVGDNVAVINIPEGRIGGVRNKETNEYLIIPPGQPVVIDRKEYVDPGYIDLDTCEAITYMTSESRKTSLFPGHDQGQVQLAKNRAQLVNIQRGQVAAVNEYGGKSYIIEQPGQYLLSNKKYNLEKTVVVDLQLEEQAGNHIIDAQDFYICLIDPREAGVVKNMHTGQYKIIPSGRHILDKQNWFPPELFSRHEEYIETDAAWVLLVSPDKKVGAFDKKGQWHDFSETHSGKRVFLNRNDFFEPVKFPRNTREILNFGPYLYTMISGNVHVPLLDRKNQRFELGEIGEQMHRVDEKLLLEPLPKSDQFHRLEKLQFTSRDQFRMNVDSRVTIRIDDPIKTMQYLRSHADRSSERKVDSRMTGSDRKKNLKNYQQSAEDFYAQTMSYRYEDLVDDIKDIASNQLRTNLSYLDGRQLTTNADGDPDPQEIKQCRTDLESAVMDRLQKFFDTSGIGLKAVAIDIEGSPKFSDQAINEAKAAKKLSEINQAKYTLQEQSNRAQAQSEAVKQIIETETLEKTQKIANRTTLETQKNQHEIMLAEARAQKEKVKLETEAKKLSITEIAEAEAKAEKDLNEAGETRPAWRTTVDLMMQQAEALQALAGVQHDLSPVMRAALNMQGAASMNSSSGGGGSNDVYPLFNMQMMQQLVKNLEQNEVL